MKTTNKLVLLLAFFLFLPLGGAVLAHQPVLIYNKQGDIQVNNPEISRAFYDQLKGERREYFIDSVEDFDLYINILVPNPANRDGRYFVDVFLLKPDGQDKIASIDDTTYEWQEFYEPFGRDHYFKGPEINTRALAGKYKIEVYSLDNQGKYVLAIGKKEFFDAKSILNIYWQLPLLKMTFFNTSVMQFFLTPFGIAGVAFIGIILLIIAVISYLISLIKEKIRQATAKTILLTSNGMQVKDEIIKLLQKPSYDIMVAFITTAAKPEGDVSFVKTDWEIMKDTGFNIQEVDIEGKTESQLFKILKLKDIIFVEGGNTFYLLKAMRACNFEKIMRKLLKNGKVYIGASAGSIVAGRTIETASWGQAKDANIVNLKNLRGLNFVPFNVFVHYKPEDAEIIKQKIKNPKKRKKKLRILTDDQALLAQANQIILLGKGEEIIV
jgi:dipeptidase E